MTEPKGKGAIAPPTLEQVRYLRDLFDGNQLIPTCQDRLYECYTFEKLDSCEHERLVEPIIRDYLRLRELEASGAVVIDMDTADKAKDAMALVRRLAPYHGYEADESLLRTEDNCNAAIQRAKEGQDGE